VAISAAHSFNPQGSGPEHDASAPLAVDGDPTTMWTTSLYTNRLFGNLKQGSGLAFTLDGSHRLATMAVTSPTQDWAASVYVAAGSGTQLADWGNPVARATNISGSATFDLKGAEGAAVLLWITDLGTDNQVKIAEVTLTG
jgi:putative peptidoglycan lipid II flippase